MSFFTGVLTGTVFLIIVLIIIVEILRLKGGFMFGCESESLESEIPIKCPVIENRKESLSLELNILRNLANHYAENGYSKAIRALRDIEDLKK